MKKLIVIYFLILATACELTLTDGENNYRLGFNETENVSEENEVSIDEDRHVFENMNIDVIKIHEYEPRELIISQISDDGTITNEIGSFEVIDGKVLLPDLIELKGFYHFELISEEENIQIVVPEFKHSKKKDHNKHLGLEYSEKHNLPKYILGPKEKIISDEVLYLVYERGYKLRPSFKFVHKQSMKKEDDLCIDPLDEMPAVPDLSQEYINQEGHPEWSETENLLARHGCNRSYLYQARPIYRRLLACVLQPQSDHRPEQNQRQRS